MNVIWMHSLEKLTLEQENTFYYVINKPEIKHTEAVVKLFLLLSAGGGNLIRVSHFPRLLCQQWLHFSAAWRSDKG